MVKDSFINTWLILIILFVCLFVLSFNYKYNEYYSSYAEYVYDKKYYIRVAVNEINGISEKVIIDGQLKYCSIYNIETILNSNYVYYDCNTQSILNNYITDFKIDLGKTSLMKKFVKEFKKGIM
ncbi:MAG: hypothetical protein PHD02_04435 [Bacilli bacterium]|nr:hypothetical protein [Bacilli bacterium]